MGVTHFFLLLFIVWLAGKCTSPYRRPMREDSDAYLTRYYKDKCVRKF